jgi:hypothetical protein
MIYNIIEHSNLSIPIAFARYTPVLFATFIQKVLLYPGICPSHDNDLSFYVLFIPPFNNLSA